MPAQPVSRPAAARRRAAPPLLWLLLGLLSACGLAWIARPGDWRPERRSAEPVQRVFSYRQWQSTGIKLEAGDRFALRAQGDWAYSPIVGLHGPEGGRPAVSSYPLPAVRGGALIGRVGESGQPFYVGQRVQSYADQGGLLYLRINDDLLGDNQGVMTVEVEVVRATATPRP